MPGYLFGLVNRTERGPKPKLSWRQLYLFDWPFLFFLCNNGKKNLDYATISPSIFPISDSRCKSHDGGWAAMVREQPCSRAPRRGTPSLLILPQVFRSLRSLHNLRLVHVLVSDEPVFPTEKQCVTIRVNNR